MLDDARGILGNRLRGAEPTEDAARIRITVGYEELDGVRQLLQLTEHIQIARRLPEAPAFIATLAHLAVTNHDGTDD